MCTGLDLRARDPALLKEHLVSRESRQHNQVIIVAHVSVISYKHRDQETPIIHILSSRSATLVRNFTSVLSFNGHCGCKW